MDYTFLTSFSLVFVTILIYKYFLLNLEKEIAISSIRAFMQLMLLGFVLLYLFEIEDKFIVIAVLLFMCAFASYTASSREKLHKYTFLNAFISLTLSLAIVLGSLVLLNIIKFEAKDIITLGGIIVGNALNSYVLALNRLKSEVKKDKDLIESKVALGDTIKNAYSNEIKVSIKASLIPIINNLQTVGVVLIPGITTGMILAGANPIDAVSFQLVIMFMILAISLISSIFDILLSYKYLA
ncbi:MAG: iron export ABC transporter permease subunit FetB [Campylobacterales bacterium]|nr:iron export ABC transporter permease subunit FetB [Campylobacterales bacterium]